MTPNFLLLTPEFILAGVGILVLLIDFITPRASRGDLGWLALTGLALAVVVALFHRGGTVDTLYDGLFRVDAYSTFAFVFLGVLGGAVIVASMDYVLRHIDHVGEYYGLLILSVLGMVLMASAGELLTAYIALELMTFSLYVMVSLERRGKTDEAGTKYIILGALSSAVLLYGISMVWGATGTTTYDGIAAVLSQGGGDSTLVVGLALILAGVGFKVAAVPFHMWAPDVYQGAPTPVTAYLAIGSKAAVFIWALRLFGEGLIPAAADWRILLAVLATATMVLGNLVAIVQRNIKRLLAYSSIGQAGYLLAGVAALGKVGDGGVTISVLASNGVLLHLVGYAVSTLAAFLVVITVYNARGSDEIDDYGGLAKRSPFLAMVMAVALFSLAGLPFFAGFTTKFYLFTGVASSGFLWLAGLGVAASLVSLYYYLRVIKVMYIDAPAPDAEPVEAASSTPRPQQVGEGGGKPGEGPVPAPSSTPRPQQVGEGGGKPGEGPVPAPSSTPRPQQVGEGGGKPGEGLLAEPVPDEVGLNSASPIPISRVSWTLLATLLGAMVLIGVWPTRLVDVIDSASRFLR